MKSLLLPLAACAALTGCATYGDPYYGYGYGYPHTSVGVYSGYPSYHADLTYRSYTRPAYSYGGPVYRDRSRDRDRDGIPNRVDRDRDNDGVPNRQDARPNNPRRH